MKLTKKEYERVKPVAKRIIKQRLIRFINRLFAGKTIVKNAFHTDYAKRVLITGLVESYKNPQSISKRHSNLTELYTIGKIFHQLGFQVDCVAMDAEEKIDYNRYDVFVGAVPLIQDTFSVKKELVRIYYAPGAHPMFASSASSFRIRDTYREKGVWMISSYRYAGPKNWCYPVLLTDKVIVLGNEFTLNTYLEYDPQKERYTHLPAFFFNTQAADLEAKNYSEAKKHFLWFGSTGLIHKGLDICLDIFLKRDDATLHICGAPRKEKEFWNYYDPLIKDKKNIVVHGFVDIASEEFATILDRCGFVIFPSVSEGGAVALYNVIGNGGLIPLYSRSTGVDFQDFGMESPEVDITLFEQMVEKALKMPDEEMKRRSVTGYETVRENFTLEHYEANLKKIITGVLQDKKLL